MKAGRQKAFEASQSELEQTQGACLSGIDQTTGRFTLLQDEFTRFVAPEGGAGQRQ